ncbi:hypothetical protein CH63R_03036 [Colletotrichum higginsianum IMI 349063]|uniref:Uncharacterized protein n=1 Tax=Colletotrichum higginsianum (strain IMI 349063) TaxID=759273 RepID=A0A1B7YQJ2_COLHI|nr:hypothetical protein CH63R_03036 [Colletotrichum higginsianum IMI 349063]OBR14310.1 hypothetical protein CH63R_03036 [Colletotrichum higginsianum IMI 349063]
MRRKPPRKSTGVRPTGQLAMGWLGGRLDHSPVPGCWKGDQQERAGDEVEWPARFQEEGKSQVRAR